eukprot:TRINITY_DN25008_c0_g1_i1.p3 TRINITY_DN25008_c0_g1~~TRINITY_DN25008_c0_g1_i1.p3  ORF type:complete len:100 (-),score=14.88 TRINITY_DN25008_c0_g1_i1:446-745(-)
MAEDNNGTARACSWSTGEHFYKGTDRFLHGVNETEPNPYKQLPRQLTTAEPPGKGKQTATAFEHLQHVIFGGLDMVAKPPTNEYWCLNFEKDCPGSPCV